MKTILVLCLLSAFAFADSILVNNAGGTNAFTVNPLSLTASGNNYNFAFTGGTTSAAAVIGKFTTGFITMSSAAYSLEGQVSHIFFNPKTGLLQGQFVGQQIFASTGNHFHIYHATFYERFDLKNHTNLGGYVAFSTAPEPETYALFLTGLLMCAYRWSGSSAYARFRQRKLDLPSPLLPQL
jgi:hypothetical protein